MITHCGSELKFCGEATVDELEPVLLVEAAPDRCEHSDVTLLRGIAPLAATEQLEAVAELRADLGVDDDTLEVHCDRKHEVDVDWRLDERLCDEAALA